MRSRHVAMSWEEFELLPAHPGWKQEYWDGTAHITPRARSAVVRVAVAPRPLRSALPIRPLSPADEASLVSAYLDAFAETVEYCDWDRSAIEKSAKTCLQDFFSGRHGEVLPASCSSLDATAETAAEAVVGAALLVRKKDGTPMLDILFVRPRWQRSGLATALVSWSLNELHRNGETSLRSRYHLANEASRAWHRTFGFEEEPDLRLAELYLRCAAHELWRGEKRGDLGEAQRLRLLAEKEGWERRVRELEALVREKGSEAVSPGLWLD